MEDDGHPLPNVGSFRRLTGTLVGTVHNRLELFAVEMQEEETWVSTLVVWATLGAVFALLAFVSICVTVVWLFPENQRPLVMLAFSALFVCSAVGSLIWLRKLWKAKPPPLSQTLSELKKDIQWMQSQD